MADGKNSAKWQWELANTYRDGGKFKEAIAVYRQCDSFPEDLNKWPPVTAAWASIKRGWPCISKSSVGIRLQPPGAVEMARTFEEGYE